jgi:predicted  nucleic acid-binding Zn-ribbon protein
VALESREEQTMATKKPPTPKQLADKAKRLKDRVAKLAADLKKARAELANTKADLAAARKPAKSDEAE